MSSAKEILSEISAEQITELGAAKGSVHVGWATKLKLRYVKCACGVQYETLTDLGKEVLRLALAPKV